MMTKKTAAKDETTRASPSPSHKATKSFISDERRVLDALEDDEVREVLRGFHQSSEHPPVKKTLVK